MKVPLQQSAAWQTFLRDLGETTFFVENQHYQYLAIKKSTKIGPYLYLPYGPVCDKTGLQAAYEALQALAQREHAIFTRIEPQDPQTASYWLEQAKSAGLKFVKSHDLNPADTWVLDLTPPEKDLVLGFSHGTRSGHNTYQKKNLLVETSKDPADLHALVDLQKSLAATKKIGTFSEQYLATELKQPFATLYLVKYTGPGLKNPEKPQNPPEPAETHRKSAQIAAASLFFDHDGTRYYMQSAADPAFKKLPATVALLSRAIFDAKAKGLKTFDFWGIAPDGADKSHPWAGFTKFKKSFGGHPVHYPGTHDLVHDPLRYTLYQKLRALNRLLRHI